MGWSDTDAHFPYYRAFLWQGGVMTDLGTLRSARSEASDINERGQAVGGSCLAGPCKYGSTNHAFLWDRAVMTDLGTLGYRSSLADAINDRGQVVGAIADTDFLHAFTWQDGVMTDLGTLGGIGSRAHDINELGQIVGAVDLSYGPATRHGFLLTR